MTTTAAVPQTVAAARAFNRFYTRCIGVLDEHILDSNFSLTEVRVLYELAHRDTPAASEIRKTLGLDAGYLSRMLRRFEEAGYLRREADPDDGRRSVLQLTAKGRKTFQPLERRSQQNITAMLEHLPASGHAQLLDAMATVRQLLDRGPDATKSELRLRQHRPGDIGWAIMRHGELYALEYGWDERFEALVGEILARFVQQLDSARERCWIAELDGRRVGCVFLVRNADDPDCAQLRCLLVEPDARGHNIGRRLVTECIAFARQAGYGRMRLWTNDVLISARRIYEAAGFQLIHEEKHHSFGKRLTGQTWEMPLQAPATRRAAAPPRTG